MKKRYGTAKAVAVSFFMLVFIFVGVFLTRPAGVFADNGCDVDRLLELAHERNLHEDRYWHILMHYEKKWFGVESQVDDPDFFLAAEGKSDPAAELAATIAYLFGTDTDQEALCRFYARYGWLEKELEGALPTCFKDRSCPEIDRIDPQSASLVFPTYYLNNPASMFGHTLITIDTAYSSKRLANAVNYAALADPADGVALAISGLTGLYRGYYSVMPYYKKIQEYSDINQRDMWEYRLNLTPAELRRMVRHIREMDQIYSDYYFFDENCSFNLLYLLEAARPSAHLTGRFHIAAIPVDTIKAVKEEGFIAGVDFRPAKTTRINYLTARLTDAQIETVLALIEGTVSPEELLERPDARREKILMLDLAVEVIQYRYASRELEKSAYRKQLLAALGARSQLGRLDTDWQENVPVPPRPELGHDSKRASAGFGVQSGDAFVEARFRPALTDLTDMDYIPHQGAQIEFGDLRTRYYPESRRLALQQFDIIDIVSIAPVGPFSKPLSWKFNTGWHRKPLENDADASYFRINGGAGLAGRLPLFGLAYFMAEAEFDISGDMPADYALGGGAAVGTVLPVGRICKIHLYGRGLRFFAGGRHSDFSAGAISNFRISRNHHLSLEGRWEDAGDARYETVALWHWFF